jgi:tryptophan 2-monooxygenase
LLDEVYRGANLNLAAHFAARDPFVEINWEEQPFFLCAFKMNLPGSTSISAACFPSS